MALICRGFICLLVVLNLFSYAGCSLLTTDYNNLKEVKVTLTGLNVKDLNPLKPSFLVRLRLDNPNDVDISMDGADVALSLDGQPVADGLSRSPLTLKKLGSSEVDMEVYVNTLNAIQQFLLIQSKPALDYRVSGHLHLLNWLGSLGQLPFDFSGSMDQKTIMRAAGSP
jgi:LEA14-like dessication related protein